MNALSPAMQAAAVESLGEAFNRGPALVTQIQPGETLSPAVWCGGALVVRARLQDTVRAAFATAQISDDGETWRDLRNASASQGGRLPLHRLAHDGLRWRAVIVGAADLAPLPFLRLRLSAAPRRPVGLIFYFAMLGVAAAPSPSPSLH